MEHLRITSGDITPTQKANMLMDLKRNAEKMERQAVDARKAFDRELDAVDEDTARIIIRRMINEEGVEG